MQALNYFLDGHEGDARRVGALLVPAAAAYVLGGGAADGSGVRVSGATLRSGSLPLLDVTVGQSPASSTTTSTATTTVTEPTTTTSLKNDDGDRDRDD